MGWDLGKVKPHVKKAGELLGKQFGIANIGGWRAHGSVPGSLHPKGRALDMMTSDRAKGDALAAAAIKNYKQLGITQVIWWRRIWTPKQGWHPYDGPSAHTDHVHLSFGEEPGSGGALDLGRAIVDKATGGISGTLGALVAPLTNIAEGVGQVGVVASAVTRLFLPSNMLRAACGVAGALFLLIGIFFMSREARQ